MSKQLDISELLRRGGEMTDAEVKQLTQQMVESQLARLANAVRFRNSDQPLKVLPAIGTPPKLISGYFTQQKFIWGKTPKEMERILGIFGKLRMGAYILQFKNPLISTDYENRAYTYLPEGKEFDWEKNKDEKVYLPGAGAPQWVTTRKLLGTCIAHLKPEQVFNRFLFL